MEAATSEPATSSDLQFPPGFRFHPLDEELIVHYLQNKVTSRPLPATIIADVDLYKYNPWELPKKALFGTEDEWYFFTPREKKYPNGVRPNRAAGVGYWKATGTDKPIFSSSDFKRVGVKKALVFYIGRAPRGLKTDWMMSEYRLIDATTKLKGSMRLDAWVLCRVRLKDNSMLRSTSEVPDTHNTKMVETSPKIEEAPSIFMNNNNHDMTSGCLNNDSQLLESILAGQALAPTRTISTVSGQGSKNGNNVPIISEDGSEKMNPPLAGSQSDKYFNLLKREPSEENVYQNILLSDKQPNVNYRDENPPLGNTFPNEGINYYSQLQEFYMSDPVIDFQQLNELAFTGKDLK